MRMRRYAPLSVVVALVCATPASAFHSTPTGFGFHSFEASVTGTQAGSHPDVTVAFELNDALNGGGNLEPVGGEVENLYVNAPPGLVGNPNAAPQCTRQELESQAEGGCPADTQVGVASSSLGLSGPIASPFTGIHVYNMVPPPGAPAEFAFILDFVHVFLDAGVRSGGDYGITEHADHLPQYGILSNTITLWGIPGEHNGSGSTTPLLTLPTSCEEPLTFSAEADTWEEPNQFAHASALTPAITGCGRLVHFTPSISAAPDTSAADTPTGLTVDVRSPQGLNPEGLATSGIKDTTVTLPESVVINPGQAAGLVACQPDEEGLGGETDEGPPECPAASKVGTVEIETPLLKDTLKGNVYVLQSNPPNLQLLLAASAEGVNVKLVGDVHLDETTGRLTTTFDGNPPSFEGTPDLPFTELRLSFSGGAQAALATPTQCGIYTTTSDFTPWSSPFIPDVFPSSSFAIDSGPDGSACPSSPSPFAPSMIAGSTTDQAGGFTDFSLLLQRGDGQQRIEKLQFKAPQGLSGMISSVPLCPEPQASAGTCSAASQIGHAVVTSGPGPYPLVLPQPDDPELPIYLTGPYKGAPFGLSIVTPVIAGPFNLGTIVTRASIAVDPHTAQITITTDPLPQIVKGVPTDLRSIDSVIDRPGFMVNPTNCDPQSFSGTATSAQGSVAAISSPFQVGSCRSLEFAPKFQASIDAQSTKADGERLTTKLAYPNATPGTQANITKVKVDLPIQLPSRLTTLQKACLASVFEANPASCPPQSIVGQAKVITPLLPVPLTGPAYFVSHGGEAFPSLTIVLQGDGVTVDLIGTTFISKAGITSTTFEATPDTPFNTFELTLPQGKFSALGANLPPSAKYSFCGQKLKMPTLFVAQNGLEIRQSTPISVTGCAEALTRPQKLAAALQACKKDKNKSKRVECEKQAHKKYAPARKKK
jgi:hypothetical protein